ncbi:response regulator [Vibrio algarum]|uniref:Response regulator n=1 Tax=Vibrio algarum TaxID=3020714 RepID=A0ABT4YXN5_9VIBR|nr:response regulator [Vibrio sp. KJ40-1]MDB1126331.1 response regulator [Vibrio sp. KJ40-1]
MTTVNHRFILVVEDEPTLANVLCEYIEHSGMRSYQINNGGEVISWVKANQPSLIVLDLMLPVRDGLDIFRELRTFSQVPVIMATAKVDEIDRLLGLELGADDYICKPYSPREVIARIKNVLRRSENSNTDQPQQKDFMIDAPSMKAMLRGKELVLTPAEFKLLHFLYLNEGRIYSREQLMDRIYDDGRVVTDRTIDSHIKNLRKKLQEVDSECDYIKSIYSVGYKFEL